MSRISSIEFTNLCGCSTPSFIVYRKENANILGLVGSAEQMVGLFILGHLEDSFQIAFKFRICFGQFDLRIFLDVVVVVIIGGNEENKLPLVADYGGGIQPANDFSRGLLDHCVADPHNRVVRAVRNACGE